MSYKTTQRVTREQALEILLEEIPNLSNDALGDVLDALADTEQSRRVSKWDNFIVSEFNDKG